MQIDSGFWVIIESDASAHKTLNIGTLTKAADILALRDVLARMAAI